MRRQRKRNNPFVGLTLSSLGTIIIVISMIRLFAHLFGEMMTPAIPTLSAVLMLPVVTMLIGIVGWVWTEYSDRFDQ
jgi:hypothetical protein